MVKAGTWQDRGATQATSGGLALVAAAFAIALCNYGLNVALGWLLTPAEYGQVGVCLTLILLGTWLVGAGFPWVVARAVAALGRGEDGTCRVIKGCLISNVTLGVALCVLLMGAFAAGWLPLQSQYGLPLLLVSLTLLVMSARVILDAILQGLQRFTGLAAGRLAEALVNAVISLALVLFGLGATGVVAGNVLGTVMALLLFAWLTRDCRFFCQGGRADWRVWQQSAPMLLAVVGGVALSYIDLLGLRLFSSAATSDQLAGQYQAAAVLARVPVFAVQAITQVLFVRVAQSRTDRVAAQKQIDSMLRLVLLGPVAIGVVFAALPKPVLAFFFPAGYQEAALPLAMLAVAMSMLCITNLLAAAVQGLGRERLPAALLPAAVALEVAGLAFLVPRLQSLGAALAALLAAGVALSGSLVAYWQLLDLKRHAATLLRAAAGWGVLFALLRILPHQGRLWLAADVALSLLLYLLLAAWLGLLQWGEVATATCGLQRLLPAPLSCWLTRGADIIRRLNGRGPWSRRLGVEEQS